MVLAPMDCQEPASHCDSTYQIHIDDIQWSGGNSYGFMTANGISLGSDLLIKFQTVLAIAAAAVQNRHGLAPMDCQEPASHCNGTYQIHIDDIKRSGGNSYGFMTANGISFGSDLLIKFQTVLASCSCSPKLAWFGTNDYQESASHYDSTYQINIDDKQWSGGNSYGFMMANGISLGQIC
jgi:hypothetical protein